MKVVPSAVRDAVALMLKVPGNIPLEVLEAASWVVLVTVVKLIGPKNPPMEVVRVNGRTDDVIAVVRVNETLADEVTVVVLVTAGMLVVDVPAVVPPLESLTTGMVKVGAW